MSDTMTQQELDLGHTHQDNRSVQPPLLTPHITVARLTLITAVASCNGGISSPADAGGDGNIPTGGTEAGANDGTAPSDASSSDAASPGTCTLPQVIGPCDAAFPRYWFNPLTARCEFFTYGGCGGNANNFPTVDACVSTCAPTASNACLVVDCQPGKRCVFQAATPVCAAPCGDAGTCPIITESCGCGASCPNCRDCISVCL